LTGGIASGKTTVAKLFAELGAVLIDTDIIAREVVATGTAGLRQVVDTFGRTMLNDDGTLDRNAMRGVIFSDAAKRLQLEAILHPIIRKETERQLQTAGGPYQIVVVPLLVGSPLRNSVDRILVVDCSEAIQLERLRQRDDETVKQARNMIGAQAARQERLALADDVVLNDGDFDSTRQQVARLHLKYQTLAAGQRP